MSKRTSFANVAKGLSRDPRLKQAIAKARSKKRGKDVRRVDNATGVALLLLGIASRFSKRKRARAIDEAMDVIYLLVQVSIVLKENVFDRPQVKKFFSQSFRHGYSLARQFVSMVLPKAKAPARPKRALRSV
jgi:hypothetical protein